MVTERKKFNKVMLLFESKQFNFWGSGKSSKFHPIE